MHHISHVDHAPEILGVEQGKWQPFIRPADHAGQVSKIPGAIRHRQSKDDGPDTAFFRHASYHFFRFQFTDPIWGRRFARGILIEDSFATFSRGFHRTEVDKPSRPCLDRRPYNIPCPLNVNSTICGQRIFLLILEDVIAGR
jgi:hypothetical protein